MTFERLLNDAALDAPAAPVNQADFPKAGCVRGCHVLVHHRSDVAGMERVQVQRGLNRDFVRHEYDTEAPAFAGGYGGQADGTEEAQPSP